MDLNLHLLTSDQLYLIQDICLIKKDKIHGHIFDGFEVVRDKIDLIILDKSTGYGMYEEDLKYEEEEIRRIIEKEKEQREHGQFPTLPNYDNPDNKEPMQLPLDGPQRRSPLWTRLDKESSHTDPVINFIEWKPGHGRMPALSSTIEFIIEDDEKSHGGSLTDWQLLQLDACLCRIKWDRLRLMSKTITGAYEVSGNRKHKRVYLFPDAIKMHALGNGVDVNCVLAGTFIHEMFHAYFDDTKAKDFIYQYLKRIVEIEEAVTECSTLLFLSKYYSHYLPFSEHDIMSKFASGQPDLQCYGVGYHLYNQLVTLDTVKQIFSKYRRIQRAPRLSYPDVRDYILEVKSATPNANKCVNYIALLINYFNKIVGADMKHYSFNGVQYGWECRMVNAVLDYYVSKHNPTLAQMQADFNTAANPDFFEDLSVVHALGKEKEYNLDAQIHLRCGATIVPIKSWKNKSNADNTPRFIDMVKLMYDASPQKIDAEINVLR